MNHSMIMRLKSADMNFVLEQFVRALRRDAQTAKLKQPIDSFLLEAYEELRR